MVYWYIGYWKWPFLVDLSIKKLWFSHQFFGSTVTAVTVKAGWPAAWMKPSGDIPEVNGWPLCDQWPWRKGTDWLEVPIPNIRPIYIRPKFQGISPENMAQNMVRLRTSNLGSWNYHWCDVISWLVVYVASWKMMEWVRQIGSSSQRKWGK